MLDRNAKVLSRLIRIDGWIVFDEDRQRLLRVLDRPSPSLHGRFDESLGTIRLLGDEIITHQQPVRIEVEPIIGVGKILPMFADFLRLRGEGWPFGQKEHDRVHLTQHQTRGAGRRCHIDPSHRIGIDSVKLRKGRKHHSACVTDARTDSLAFEILRRLDVVFFQRSEGIERLVVNDAGDLDQRAFGACEDERRRIRECKVDRAGRVRRDRRGRPFALDNRHVETGVLPEALVESGEERRMLAVGREIQEKGYFLRRTADLRLRETERHRAVIRNGRRRRCAARAAT